MRVEIPSRRLVIASSFCVLVLAAVAYAATIMLLAVGTIPQSQLVDGPATVTDRTLTIKPGEVLAWHYHPGYAFNVVTHGTLTVEDGCGGEQTLQSTGNATDPR
jgi:hypothetical protein